MTPSLKRRLLRPFIEISRATRKLHKELRTPEEIIDMRDKIHLDLMQAQKKGSLLLATELGYKESMLNWVLKNV